MMKQRQYTRRTSSATVQRRCRWRRSGRKSRRWRRRTSLMHNVLNAQYVAQDMSVTHRAFCSRACKLRVQIQYSNYRSPSCGISASGASRPFCVPFLSSEQAQPLLVGPFHAPPHPLAILTPHRPLPPPHEPLPVGPHMSAQHFCCSST